MLTPALILLLALAALLGHLAMSVRWINRLHGTATPKAILRVHDAMWCLIVAGAPLAAAWWYWQQVQAADAWWPREAWPLLLYLVPCWAMAAFVVYDWRRLQTRRSTVLEGNHTQVLDMRREVAGSPVGDWPTSLAARLPGNEILQLSIHEKRLRLPRLPEPLSGLSVVHLTDLHVTGQLSRAYYEEVVRQANRLEGDVVAITGDILDRRRLLEWLPATLGKLEAKHGVYFVLGNHDMRTKYVDEIRGALAGCGLVDLGGRWQRVDVGGWPVVLAGNELPWLPPAADMEHCPAEFEGRRPLRVLLSHSPDQIDWARSFDFDLMLAGHCHGGQFRLPGIGPILSPSRHGVRYASGTFYEAPTVLHVSRGIAGTRPLRFNCPPELTRLVLE